MELSKAFDDVMKTYDKKFRPKYGGEKYEHPLEILIVNIKYALKICCVKKKAVVCY